MPVPQVVHFSEYTVSPQEMTMRRVSKGPFPASWTRLVIDCHDMQTRPLQTWIFENTHGRFGIVQSYPRAIIYFEHDSDAMLFRLQDGHEAWRENASVIF